MGQLNATGIYKAIKGLFSALDSTDETLLKNTLYNRTEKVAFTDGGTAANTQAATIFWTNDLGTPVRVTSAKAMLPVTAAGHASNNATITLSKIDAAGSVSATVAAYTSDTTGGTATAFVPKALTLTVANVVVPDGWSLRVALTKASSGVAIAGANAPAYLIVKYEPEQ